jgi:hypothetical protein
MQKISTLKILSIVAFLGVLTVNYLANALPINGVSSADVSNKYFNQFAPAGITFTIWGIIYLLIIGTIIWQLKLVGKSIDTLNKWFIANSLLNATWLFAWHYEILPLTLVLMLGILYTLVQINKTITDELPDTLSFKWRLFGLDLYCHDCQFYDFFSEHQFQQIWLNGYFLDRCGHWYWLDNGGDVGRAVQEYLYWISCYLGIGRHYYSSKSIAWAFYGD